MIVNRRNADDIVCGHLAEVGIKIGIVRIDHVRFVLGGAHQNVCVHVETNVVGTVIVHLPQEAFKRRDVCPVVVRKLRLPFVKGHQLIGIRFAGVERFADGGIRGFCGAVQVSARHLREQTPRRIAPHIAQTLFFLREVYADLILIERPAVLPFPGLAFDTILKEEGKLLREKPVEPKAAAR